MCDITDQKVIELGYRRLCSDMTLQTKKEGFFKDYLATIAELITPEEFEEFGRKKTDEERVLYLWTLKAFHSVMADFEPIYKTKSAVESRNRREEGNAAFKNKEFKPALALYSQSVIHAPWKHEDGDEPSLALALANRSAVLVHLKEYASAIRDIQLSVQLGYPPDQRYKLYERMAYCHMQIGESLKAKIAFNIALDCLDSSSLDGPKKEEWRKNINASLSKVTNSGGKAGLGEKTNDTDTRETKFPPLLGGCSPQFPSASRTIYVDADDKLGRFFRAKEDIKPGETLVAEKPYAACLLAEKFGTHCHHCFARLIAPLGCTKCRSVAFCSVQCRDQAESTYHQYECTILDVMVASGMSVLCFLAMRMVTQNPLSRFVELRPNLQEEPLGQQHGGSVYDPVDYRNVYNLTTLSSMRTATDFLDRTVMALFQLKCLRKTHYFGTGSNEEQVDCITDQEVFVATLLLRHLQMLQFNAHEVHEFLQVGDFTMRGTKTAYIGLGVYPTVALFNHSCHPAVARFFIGTSLVICSARTIQSGDVVAENYGPMFTSHSKSDRQSRLKGRYWFQCKCQACENNWPTYDGMAEMDSVLTRCLYCLGQVQPIPPQNTYVRCKSCKKQMMMSAIQEKIEEVTALYRSAMQAMDRMEVERAVSALSLFISIMERLDVGPVKERHLAEEALRLCIGTRGTKYCANNHLTLRLKPNAKQEEPQTHNSVSEGM